MAYVKAQLTVPQIEDANGNPGVGYTISAYIWDTSTPTPMYTSSAGAGSATSFLLNSLGQPQTAGGTAVDIFLDDSIEAVKFIITDADGVPVGPTIGPVYPAANSPSGAFYARTAAEIAASVTPTYYYYPPGDVRRYGVSSANTASGNATALVNAINASAGLPLALHESINMALVDITTKCEIVGNGVTITLSGTNAGFRIVADFDFFKARNFKIVGDGVVGNNHCGIYTDSGTRNVTDGTIVDVTIQTCVIGIETTPFRRCWIVRPRILTTVGTSSGQGYGIIGAGGNEFLFIDQPYVYRASRHSIYCGNVRYTQIVSPIIVEHAYGDATWDKHAALAISRDGDCAVSNPQFIRCANEVIGIDDEATPTGEQANIVITGGFSREPQGAARTLRIGEGTASADNAHRNIKINGFMFEANETESIYDVEINHGENVHLDLILDGNKSFVSDRNFISLDGQALETDFIFIKVRGIVSGSGALYPVRIQDGISLGVQRVLLDVAVVGANDLVSFATSPTNTNINVVGANFAAKLAGYFYQPYEAAGEAIVGIEGGDAGYGAGISARSKLSGGTTVKEMGRLVWDGVAAWNSTASTQDAEASLYVTQDGTESKAAKFSRTPSAGMTGFWLWDADNGQIEQVSVGAADSGGAGYKLLRIAN